MTQKHAFSALIRPGKTAALQEVLDALSGRLQPAFEESRRRVGITRESVWIVSTVVGDVAVGFFEADDPNAIASLQYTDDPFDRWFEEQLSDILVPSRSDEPPPPSRLISGFEWSDTHS